MHDPCAAEANEAAQAMAASMANCSKTANFSGLYLGNGLWY
jgi:hypothetical protein